VKEKLPGLVGVPLITPALERVRPAAIAPPRRVHVYGCSPPVAPRETEYCPAKGAFGKAGRVVIVKAGLTTMVKAFVAVSTGVVLEEAWTVKL
jgi:hypothetical protein